jgi:hypothetical protein
MLLVSWQLEKSKDGKLYGYTDKYNVQDPNLIEKLFPKIKQQQ